VPAGAEIGEIADWYGHPTATYATFEADGKTVKEFGNLMSMASIAAIPPGAFSSYQWLKVPKSVAEQTFIKSYELNFMAMGHPPAQVYDIPHVENHAFGWDQETVSSLTCQGAKDGDLPATDLVPAGQWDFSPIPGIGACFPGVGIHGFDLKAPEFNGTRFTFAYQVLAARGEFLSYEPKYTIEQLQKRKDFTIALKPPSKHARATKMPSTVKGTYLPAADAYVTVYTDFVAVPAAN
jgi:hypothetical protein